MTGLNWADAARCDMTDCRLEADDSVEYAEAWSLARQDADEREGAATVLRAIRDKDVLP